jgi:hypothetical protein
MNTIVNTLYDEDFNDAGYIPRAKNYAAYSALDYESVSNSDSIDDSVFDIGSECSVRLDADLESVDCKYKFETSSSSSEEHKSDSASSRVHSSVF